MGATVEVDINLISSQEFDLPAPLSNIYDKAWGKQWPQSKGNIDKDEIVNERDDNNGDDDGNNPLSDLLKVPLSFHYDRYHDIQELTSIFGKNSKMGNILVVQKEYTKIYEALNKDDRNIIVTGQAGIGSYESWS